MDAIPVYTAALCKIRFGKSPRWPLLPVFYFMLSILCPGCEKLPTFPEEIAQLIRNGDVEGGDDNPVYWTSATSAAPDNEYVIEWTIEESASPTHSLKISQDSVQDHNDYAYWMQRIYLQPGQYKGMDLRLSCSIKLNGVTGGAGVDLQIQAYSADHRQVHWLNIGSRRTIKGTSDWSTYGLRLKDLSGDIRYVYVYLLLGTGSSGTVYFDDISLAVLN